MCLPASIYDSEQLSEDANLEVIAHARDLGVTMLDTAGAILRHGSAARICGSSGLFHPNRQATNCYCKVIRICFLFACRYGVGASERLLGESELPLSTFSRRCSVLHRMKHEQQALETTMSSSSLHPAAKALEGGNRGTYVVATKFAYTFGPVKMEAEPYGAIELHGEPEYVK